MYNGLQYVGEVVSAQIEQEKYASVTLVSNGYRTKFGITQDQVKEMEKEVGNEVTIPVGVKLQKGGKEGHWIKYFVRKEYFGK